MRYKTFEEFLTINYPDFEKYLTSEDIIKFKSDYDSYIEMEKVADYCLSKQFDSKAGIDYVNDYEKNMANAQKALNNLKAKINQAKMNHELNNSLVQKEFHI